MGNIKYNLDFLFYKWNVGIRLFTMIFTYGYSLLSTLNLRNVDFLFNFLDSFIMTDVQKVQEINYFHSL